MRQVSTDTLVLSLKGVEEKMRDMFLDNRSEGAAVMIDDALKLKGPVKLSKVLEAQKEIVATAQKMASEGEIMLAIKGKEMVG